MRKDSFALYVLHTENKIQLQATPASYDITAFLSHIHKDTVWNWHFGTYVKNVLVFSSDIQKQLKLA